MLKRSKLLVAFLVVTVICASVGFAAVADELLVDGSIALPVLEDSAFDTYVSFTGTPDKATTGNADASKVTASVSGDTLTVDIEDGALTAKGETITVTATIESTYVGTVTLAAETPVLSNNIENYITVTPSFTTGSITSAGTAVTDTLTVVITVTELPLEAIANGTFDITINATA